MSLLLVFLTIAFGASDDVTHLSHGDWRSAEQELSQSIGPSNEILARKEAVKKIALFHELEATQLLLKALTQSCRELSIQGRIFEKLTTELEPVLKEGVDVRVRPQFGETSEKRKQIGQRILQEEGFLDLLVETLGKTRTDIPSVEFLSTELRKLSSWRAKARLSEALGESRRKEACEDLARLFKDRDPRVRCYVVEALGKIDGKGQLPVLIKALSDKSRHVRLYAVDALRASGHPDSISALIKALSKETGALAMVIVDALREMTEAPVGRSYEDWADWWTKNRDKLVAEGAKSLRVPTKAKKKQTKPVEYYGVETHSNRVMFVVDISGSMNDSATETEVPEDGVPKRTGNRRPKMKVATEKLTEAILQFDPETRFNIITYNKYVKLWKPTLIAATRKNKNDALGFLFGLRAEEATNIFDALELAFDAAGIGAYDRYYEPQVDTIFFLTDGKATEGRIQDPGEILAEIRRFNRVSRVTIHTIGLGYLHDRDFLKALAEQNGGTYINVQ